METDVDKSSLYQCFSPFSPDTDNYHYLSKCAGLVESRNTSGDRKTRRLTDKVLDKSCLSIKKFLDQESEEDPRLLKTSHD